MKRYIALFLALTFLLCTCCQKEEEFDVAVETPNVNQDSPDPAPTPTPEEVEIFEYVNPLTGEGLHEDISMNRPIAIMINNIKQAQPQVGVSNADVIYEIQAEGGVTRMLAIFQNVEDIESIGSIRSLRSYYLRIAQSYDAILIHAGGSTEAYNDLAATGWDHICGVQGNYSISPFYRDSSRMQYGTEHSMFATGSGILKCIEDKGFRTEHKDGYDYGYTFSEAANEQCTEDAEYVKVIFNSGKNTSFTYDEENSVYSAYQFGSRYQDNGEVDMTFENLIILYADMSVYDGYGRISVDLLTTGTGYFMNDGKYTEITWSKENYEDPFTLTLPDGTPLDFGIGKSYFAIIDNGDGSVEFEKAE